MINIICSSGILNGMDPISIMNLRLVTLEMVSFLRINALRFPIPNSKIKIATINRQYIQLGDHKSEQLNPLIRIVKIDRESSIGKRLSYVSSV